MVPKPAVALSDDILALFSRAELASAQARTLLDENDRWRRSVLAQLDYMLELSAEFRKPQRATRPKTAFPDSLSAPQSGPGAAPIR